MKSGDHGNGRPGYPTEEWLQANAGPKVAFELQPSDILIFDHWTLHRTQPLAGNVKMRTSAEMRLSCQA
jgi:hypothetical protein